MDDRLEVILNTLPNKGDGVKPDYKKIVSFCDEAKNKGWTIVDCYKILKEEGYDINMNAKTFQSHISKLKSKSVNEES